MAKIKSKPKCIIEFDGKHYSKEEQAALIGEFVMCLMRISARVEAEKNSKNKKEQKLLEKSYIKFGSEAIKSSNDWYLVD